MLLYAYSSDFINMSNTSNMSNTLLKGQMPHKLAVKNGGKDAVKEISERQWIILELIIANPFLSEKAIS